MINDISKIIIFECADIRAKLPNSTMVSEETCLAAHVGIQALLFNCPSEKNAQLILMHQMLVSRYV